MLSQLAGEDKYKRSFKMRLAATSSHSDSNDSQSTKHHPDPGRHLL